MQSDQKYSKKENPRLHANPISALLFVYLVPLFWHNFRETIKEEDLFDVLENDRSSKISDKLEEIWNDVNKRRDKYALHMSLWKMFYKDFVITGILQGVKDVFVITGMPYAVGHLVAYFGNKEDHVSSRSAYAYTGLIIVCLIVDNVVSHWIWFKMKHIGMQIRTGCCSLIYRKSLRLTNLNKTSIGHVINLMSNDVSKFDFGLRFLHFTWSAPLQAIVATHIMYSTVGISAFGGMAFILLFAPIQVYLGKLNSVIRLNTALRTDERVRLMNEIINGIKIIKMYAWEMPFARLIEIARGFEIKFIRQHYYIESFVYALDTFVTRTATFITIIILLALGNQINANVAYAVTAAYNIIRPFITKAFSLSYNWLGEIHISTLRIEKFLRYQETRSETVGNKKNSIAFRDYGAMRFTTLTVPKVCLDDVSVKWDPDSTNILTNLNFCFNSNQLVAIIGPVGSGKTTLLHTILNELPTISGNVSVNGKISYAPQHPWLFVGSIRQNILFGDAYDETRYKTVVNICALETDFNILPYGDLTIVGDSGKTLSGGQKARISLARCVYKDADIYLLDDPLSAVDSKVGKQLYEECINKFLKNKLCLLVTHQLQYLQNADRIVIINNGLIVASGTYDDLENNTMHFAVLLKEICGNDKTVEDCNNAIHANSEKSSTDSKTKDNNGDENIVFGSIGFDAYRDYARQGGNWFIFSCVVLVLVINQTVASSGDYFLSYWMNVEQKTNLTLHQNGPLSRTDMVGIYSGIIGFTILLGLIHSTVLFLFLVQISKNLHRTVFERVIHATMSFFDRNPTGRILNRFSKDMGIVDEYFPYVVMDTIDTALMLLATLLLTCIINPWFALPSVGLVALLYFIRNVYMHTSRQVKRIEGVARSHIYNHTTASINGLITIRANKAEELLVKEYDSIQDNHNSAWYIYIASGEAVGLWLDLTCVILVVIVIITLLLIHQNYSGGDVGLVLTLNIALPGLLQWGVRQWSEFENNMTSVERILEYTSLDIEPKRPPLPELPSDWPEFGGIVFKDVSLNYDSNQVLHDLNFAINPGEKVGIVGRTGAGKSSTISALLQFYPLSGKIVIDGIDATKIPLNLLRSKVSMIPQESVLFSGTMRKNLDPFNEHSDDILWNALEQVELRSSIEEAQGGLDTHVSDGGSNFSIGQRQLICLARAIIKHNKIIVMDEATANIDSYTDALIQKTIRRNFAGCTIITVAHRLHTIMDSDKILVMDEGQVVEFNTPYILLQNEGLFQNMVLMTGNATSKRLQQIAEEKHRMQVNTAWKTA